MPGYSDLYEIRFSDRNSETDITSRVMGFSTTITAGIGEFGSSTCTVTLDNNDGAFNPREGGGAGAYRSMDWKTQKLSIFFRPPIGAVRVFDGVIEGFEIDDDGQFSIATITARDWIATSSSVPGETFPTVPAIHPANEAFDLAFDASTTNPNFGFGEGVTLPEFGEPGISRNVDTLISGQTNFQSIEMFGQSNVTAYDVVATNILPVGPMVHIPLNINFQSFQTVFISRMLDSSLKTPSSTPTINFHENPSLASGLAPFRNLVMGYGTDMLTTTTTIASGVFSPPETSTNSEAELKYGSHSRTYTDTAHAYEAEAKATADFWTNRGSIVRYVPKSIQTSDMLFEAEPGIDSSTFRWILSISHVPFMRVNITFTPSGGEQITVPCIIKSRRLDATPTESVVTLDLLAGIDWQSLTLDDTLLGILGGVTDTYDDDVTVYSEVGFDYDGQQFVGNRLG